VKCSTPLFIPAITVFDVESRYAMAWGIRCFRILACYRNCPTTRCVSMGPSMAAQLFKKSPARRKGSIPRRAVAIHPINHKYRYHGKRLQYAGTPQASATVKNA
jgi:hypothetical protein